jgi:peptide/nickel transport system substrate-binding protein
MGALLLVSCGVDDSGSSGGAGEALRVVLPQEPPTLEPCDSSLTATGVVLRSTITEPLVERDPDSGELEPLLATEWEATGDKEWTFTLREGVTFHDGSDFTAADAAFAIDRALNGDMDCNVDGYVFGDEVLTPTAVDDTTLKIETSVADPILPLRISFVEIVPEDTDSSTKLREPVGTGPYQMGQWNAGQDLTLDRYDDYWGDAPAYASAQYQWRTEGTVRAAMITNDEADIALGLGPDDGAGDLGLPYANNETTALRFSGGEAPLDDIRVRQAINYAIDKEGLVAGLFEGLGEPAGQLVPPGVVGYNPDIEPWPFDMDKAKELVAEAKADGVPVDTEINLIGRTAQFPKVAETADALREAMAQAGLNVKLQMVDTSRALEYQLRPFVEDAGPVALLIMHGNQAGDAQFTVDQYMMSNGAQSTFGTPEFDEMIKAAGSESEDARQGAYADILEYQNENVVQFATIAHMSGILGKAAGVDYTPNSASGDELRIMDASPAS